MTVRFISYIQTPGEKHLGIAAVSLDEKIILRYKVSLSKHGGTYIFPASYKIHDNYEPAFVIDSNITKSEIEKCIRDHITQQATQPPTYQPTQPPRDNRPLQGVPF